MMNKVTISLMALVLALVVVAAQDEASDVCDYTGLSESLTGQLATLADEDDPAITLQDIQAQIAQFSAECAGLSFSSDEYGMEPVLGPLTITDGIYRVTVTTDGFFILNGTVLEGDCEERDYRLFSISDGTANQGAQTVLETGECEVLLEIYNVTEPWLLEFEQLR